MKLNSLAEVDQWMDGQGQTFAVPAQIDQQLVRDTWDLIGPVATFLCPALQALDNAVVNAFDVCPVWHNLRGVLLIILPLPIVPEKVRSFVQPLVTLLDAFCPTR